MAFISGTWAGQFVVDIDVVTSECLRSERECVFRKWFTVYLFPFTIHLLLLLAPGVSSGRSFTNIWMFRFVLFCSMWRVSQIASRGSHPDIPHVVVWLSVCRCVSNLLGSSAALWWDKVFFFHNVVELSSCPVLSVQLAGGTDPLRLQQPHDGLTLTKLSIDWISFLCGHLIKYANLLGTKWIWDENAIADCPPLGCRSDCRWGDCWQQAGHEIHIIWLLWPS